MNTHLHQQSIRQLNQLLRDKAISPEELSAHFHQRIKNYDNKLNSFITHVEPPIAVQKADYAFDRPTQGIPIAHKDIFCVEDLLCTCGSKMLSNFISPYNATIVDKLNHSGAISLGKTNMDEFAMGSTNETSAYGAVHNPWNQDTVAGGSSGGSAAAVAARLVPAATGSDTGGSIRQPASFCGITGIKPTYGRCSRFGMVAYASSLDQAGVMAKSAEDAAIILETMMGHDPRDATSSRQPVPDLLQAMEQPIAGKTIGIPKEYFEHAALDANIAGILKESLDTLRQQGANFVEVSLPSYEQALVAYYVIAPSEASSNLSRYDGIRFGHRSEHADTLADMIAHSRTEGFGAEVKRRIMMGVAATRTETYHAFFRKAQRIRRLVQQEFITALEQCDAIASPTVASTAFPLNAHATDPVALYLSDVFTIPVNLAGLPALSMPVGFHNGMPVGLQLIGAPYDEASVLNIAHHYQQHSDWHTRTPDWLA